MIKNIIFTFLILTNFSLIAGLTDTTWLAITKDIARDGDRKDREEFEAAKQAFLHIKDEQKAKLAAQDIQSKWRPTFGIEASVGTKTRKGSLMSLTRYPLMMTKEDAKKTVEELFKNQEIAQFFDEQKFKVNASLT